MAYYFAMKIEVFGSSEKSVSYLTPYLTANCMVFFEQMV